MGKVMMECADCGCQLGDCVGYVCRAEIAPGTSTGMKNEEFICDECSRWPEGFNVDGSMTREDWLRAKYNLY